MLNEYVNDIAFIEAYEHLKSVRENIDILKETSCITQEDLQELQEALILTEAAKKLSILRRFKVNLSKINGLKDYIEKYSDKALNSGFTEATVSLWALNKSDINKYYKICSERKSYFNKLLNQYKSGKVTSGEAKAKIDEYARESNSKIADIEEEIYAKNYKNITMKDVKAAISGIKKSSSSYEKLANILSSTQSASEKKEGEDATTKRIKDYIVGANYMITATKLIEVERIIDNYKTIISTACFAKKKKSTNEFVIEDINENDSFGTDDEYISALKEVDYLYEEITEDYIEEGANSDLRKSTSKYQHAVTTAISNAKKCMKKNDISGARKHLAEAKKSLQTFKNIIKKFPKEDFQTNMFGFLANILYNFLRSFIIGIISAPIIGAIGAKGVVDALNGGEGGLLKLAGFIQKGTVLGQQIWNIVKLVQGIFANISRAKKAGDKIDSSIINAIYNQSLVVLNKMEKLIDSMDKELVKSGTKKDVKENYIEEIDNIDLSIE